MSVLDDIREHLDAVLDDLSDTDREVARNVGLDLARLHARQIQGEDVAAELRHAKSAAVSLGAAAKVKMTSAVLSGIGKAARGILAGAGLPLPI
jgi:hypothetical protein